MENILSFELNDLQKIKKILKNIVKMLSKRIYIDSNGEKKQLLDFDEGMKSIEVLNDSNIYSFKCNNNTKIYVKLYFKKISSINKVTELSDFISKYNNSEKIFVLSSPSKKIVSKLKGSEVFLDYMLIEDIIENEYQPYFEILSPKEKEECLEVYKARKNQIPYMSKNDPVAKYFNLKNNDMLRVTIPCELTGKRIDYCIIKNI